MTSELAPGGRRPSIQIESIAPTTDEEWDATWRAYPYSTYFHSREWAQTWYQYSGGSIRPEPSTIVFSDGRRAVFPVSVQKTHTAAPRRVLSSPAGTFGGWLAADLLQDVHGERLLSYARREFRNITLIQNPFDPIAAKLFTPGVWTASDFTQVIDYQVGLDVINDRLRRNQILRKYKQGIRAGLELVKVTDAASVRRYGAIYAACQSRWGDEVTSHYGPALFQSLRIGSPNIDFWVVVRNGEMIAGGPFLKAGKFHVVSWLTLADPAFLSFKPYEFLYYTLIEHYGQAGFRFFDFNQSGGHIGVAKFKASFGAMKLASNVLSHSSTSHRVVKWAAAMTRTMAKALRRAREPGG